MVDVRAWGRARAVGAVQEAERLGGTVVGTEHLLIATMADPTVRWAFHSIGVDMRAVQDQVVITTPRRPPRFGPITEDAADAVMQVVITELLDGDHPDVADVSRALQALAQRFVAHAKQSEARDILDRLGVLQHRSRLLAVFEQNAPRAEVPAPRSGLEPTERPALVPSSRMRALRAEQRPGPDASA